jgi:AbrB family looped-hinge helix DNA binding protein
MTLPAEVRKELDLEENSYVYVTRVGQLVIIKKVDELTLDEISVILQSLAKENSITKEMLLRDVEIVRERFMRERHAKASGPS